MENNENFVAEQVAENVEQTTEQTPKLYTEEEFHAKVNEATGKRVARIEKRMQKENDRKYGRLEAVLRDGLGKESIEEITDDLDNFYYEQKGVKRTQKPEFSDKDIEYLASRDVEGIISGGMEDVIDETERLQKLGAKRNAREEAMYRALSKHILSEEKNRKYAELGVTEDVYTSDQFQNFAKKFNADTPEEEIYDLYKAKYPKEHPKTMGSLKQGQTGKVKDFYTPDEIARLSEEDLRDPNVWATVRRSMTGQ